MNPKEHILNRLENAQTPISGSLLAQETGISRSMVWKYIAALQKDGFLIVSGRRGYQLSQTEGRLSRFGIERFLKTPDCRVLLYDCVDSTNLVLRELARQGAPEKTVVLTQHQTAGRGRRGKEFYSPSGSGLYMSLLLRPALQAQQAIQITTCAAVAVCRAIEKLTGQSVSIKWVNDLWINEKKVCGILTEAVMNLETGDLDAVILGIGINVFPPEGGFPSPLQKIAGAIATRETVDRNFCCRLTAQVIDEFFALYNDLPENNCYSEYRRRSALIGRKIFVLENRPYQAQVLDVEPDFGLRILSENGEEKVLRSGEVSTRLY